MVFAKPIAEIEARDLQRLVDDKVSERKTLEFKRALPGQTDESKREFLADASSFANAAGGFLIYGISEDGGVPTELVGLGAIDPDAEVLRLENLLRDAVAPRIPGVVTRAVPITDRGSGVVIHIPRSWAAPHMITFRGWRQFFSRTSVGKYPLDVQELRAAFAATEAGADRIRAFRLERIGRIISGETPIPLAPPGPRCALHVVPRSAFDLGNIHDLTTLEGEVANLAPIYAERGRNFRYNFDGVLTHIERNEVAASTYLQVYRNGIIESVDAGLLADHGDPPHIASVAFEKELVGALIRFLRIDRILGVEPPLAVMLTLLGVRGMVMGVNMIRRPGPTIDRNELLVPAMLVEDFAQPPATILRPAFDAVWNAAGWPRSPHYDEAGNWNPPRFPL